MTLPDEIERVALLGWHLYPASTRTKAACFKGATDAATHDLDRLAGWAAEYPGCNWRVVVGPSQLWALDVDAAGDDHAADGIAALKALIATNGPLPPKPTTRSGGGGSAIFFRHNGEPISGNTGTPAPGIDPRRGRLSITIPPSIHIRSRLRYRWLLAPWDVGPPDAPQWLLDAVRPPPEPQRPYDPSVTTDTRARRALMRAMDRISTAPSGAANDTLNRQAYQVARHVAARVISEQEAVECLFAAAQQRAIPYREAKATIQSAFRSGFMKPLEAAWASR